MRERYGGEDKRQIQDTTMSRFFLFFLFFLELKRQSVSVSVAKIGDGENSGLNNKHCITAAAVCSSLPTGCRR